MDVTDRTELQKEGCCKWQKKKRHIRKKAPDPYVAVWEEFKNIAEDFGLQQDNPVFRSTQKALKDRIKKGEPAEDLLAWLHRSIRQHDLDPEKRDVIVQMYRLRCDGTPMENVIALARSKGFDDADVERMRTLVGGLENLAIIRVLA